MSTPDDANGSGGPPDFIGVGALGSGAGWWHGLLRAHPEITGPPRRGGSLNFFERFCSSAMSDADIADYHRSFPRRPGTISGEWSGRYMFDGWTPPLLARAAPDAKLLAMVSDPIERYRAVFTQRRNTLKEGERLFMADIVDRRSFGAQIARLQRFFDPERILVLQFERCMRDPRGQYRRTLEFLGVRDTAFVPRRLRAHAAGRVLGRVAPRRFADRVTGHPVSERWMAQLWPDLEAALHDSFDPDVARLQRLVPDLDIGLWRNFASR
jgi:sulfotransferase family protein